MVLRGKAHSTLRKPLIRAAKNGIAPLRLAMPQKSRPYGRQVNGIATLRFAMPQKSRPYGRQKNGIAPLRFAMPQKSHIHKRQKNGIAPLRFAMSQKSRLHRRLSRGRSGEICSCRAPCIVRPRSVLAELLRSVTTQSLSSHSTLRKPPMRAAFSWSEWRDLNSRPYGPEPYALPNCATPR